MDNELIQAFLEEVFSYLPTIRTGILATRENENFTEKLSEALRYAHTIKGAAMMVGLSEVGEIAKSLENRLREIAESSAPVSEEIVWELTAQVDALEMRLNQIAVGSQQSAICSQQLEIGDLQANEEQQLSDQEQTVNQQFAATAETSFNETSAEEFEAEEFEIDEEMLDIFAVEAEDLLRVIQASLEKLAEKPDDRESLWEIRRCAHTLKGSAGIVGLSKLSRLAHLVEDLLDFLAENEIAGNDGIFEILITAADCLSALAGNEDSPQISRKINRLEEDFAATLISLQDKTSTEKPPVADNQELTFDSLPVKSPAEKTPAAAPENKIEMPPTSASAPANSEISSPTVRVSLERLDDLVNLVGELVIVRSAFEQKLADFAAQVEELRNNASRLQNSTAKLETEFEAAAPHQNLPAAVFHNLTNKGAFDSASSVEFDALEFDNYTEFHQTTRELIETAGDASTIGLELDYLQSNLEMLFDRQDLLVGEMQDKLLRLRMVNFGTLQTRLQRTVRVTAEQEEKSVELIIENENLELNSQIVDALVEPLLHLLRNAVAHGIETAETRHLLGKSPKGRITLRLAYDGMYLVLQVSDDGRGISPAALKQKAVQNNLISAEQAAKLSDQAAAELIFLSGLTTSDAISQVAGRGIGLSIVKTGIERQNGTIVVSSEKQRGTTFTLRLPLPSAITRALLIKSGGQIFALPLGSIKYIGEIDAAENAKIFEFENDEYKIARLGEMLGLPKVKKAEKFPLLLVETTEKQAKKLSAVVVEEVLQTEEIVIKPLDALAANEIYIGATILGDGSVAPVLNLSALIENYSTLEAAAETAPAATNQRGDHLTVLIVDDSPSVRMINSKMIKNSGWQPLVARDGLEALDILQAFSEPPDIVLTDVEMPRMNGYELLAAMRRQERWRKLPVVMITSRSGDKHRQKAFDLGVDEYLVKPYHDAHLLEIIKKLTA